MFSKWREITPALFRPERAAGRIFTGVAAIAPRQKRSVKRRAVSFAAEV
jgi:hypothetical protein